MDALKSPLSVAFYRIALAIAVLGAALVLAPNIIRIPYPISITYNEGWNLYHGRQVAAGEVLYDRARPLRPVNYPPLYFYLEAAIDKASWDVLRTGRWISAASLLLLAVFAGRAVRRLGGAWPEALFSATLLAGCAGAYVPQYVGMNDPQLLAHVFVFGGFLILLRDTSSAPRLLAASCLIACGLFLKHNLLAVALAIAVGLLFESRRRAVLFIAFLAGAVCILTLATLWLAGADFIHQILSPRTMSTAKLVENTRHFVTFLAAPLIAAVWWVKKNFSRGPVRYVSLYLFFSLAVGIAASSGFGTAANMFVDACLALAIIGGLFVADLRAAGPGRGIAQWLPALAVPVLAGNFLLEAPADLKGLLNGTTVAHLQQRGRIFLEDVAYLSRRPGPALCETLTLCFYAGKPMEVDPFNVSQAIVAGGMQEQPVLDLIQSGHFQTIQFKGQRMRAEPITRSTVPEMFPGTFFTKNMVAAVQANCDLKRKTQTGMFYTFR